MVGKAKPVLVVASKFPPHAGGTAVVWREWCRHWPPHRLRVIAPDTPDCATYDAGQAYSIKRIRYPDIPKLRMPLLWLLMSLQCYWECLRRRPEVVHFQHVFENAFIGPLILKTLGIPYWVHVYAEELALARRHRWLNWLVLHVLRHAQGVTAISSYTRELLRTMGFHGLCLLVHPAVDGQLYRPDSVDGQAGSGLTLLTVGRLMKRKGHDRVIKLLPQLRVEFPELNYLVVGVGPEEQSLRSLVRQLELDECVRFLGKVPDEQLVAILCGCDVFVHPNIVTSSDDVEGFGIVFLEAAACGRVTVGGNNGGTVDAVADGHSGFLVGDGEEELLAVLRRLLADPELRRQMGEAGLRFSADFSWEWAAKRVWEASIDE